MDCLIDYIGLQGCNNQTPRSGRYINRLLQGFPLESFEKIAEADQATFLGVWSDVQDRASLRMESEVIRVFAKRYQIQRIKESFDLLKFVDPTTVTACGAGYLWGGFTITLVDTNLQRKVNSALQYIHVQELRFYAPADNASDYIVKIFDLQTGETLFSKTVGAVTEGWNTITVDESFFAYRIFCAINCVDGFVSQSISSDTLNRFNACSCEFFPSDCSGAINGATARVTAVGDPVSDGDITTGSNLFGLSGVFSTGCSYRSLICQNMDLFLLAWAYLLGAEIMSERMSSSRINKWTTGIDAKNAAERMQYFEDRFAQELETVISGINLDTSDCCLDCSADYRTVTSLL
jgi:hypothetical protein